MVIIQEIHASSFEDPYTRFDLNEYALAVVTYNGNYGIST